MDKNLDIRLMLAESIVDCETETDLLILATNLASLAGVAAGMAGQHTNLAPIANAVCAAAFKHGFQLGTVNNKLLLEEQLAAAAEPSLEAIAKYASTLDTILKGPK